MSYWKRYAVLVLTAITAACSSGSSPTTPTPTVATATRVISVSGNLAFGNVSVGQSTTATFSIANSGTGVLTVSSLSVSNGMSAVLAASWTGGTIAPGSTQQVTVQFTPSAALGYSGTIAVNADQTSGSNTIAVSGTGVSVAKAALQLASSTGTYVCVTGLCSSFTYPITNVGPGCATNVQVVTRFFGSDGSGPQLGIDVPMYVPGATLSGLLFRVGSTVTLQNTIPFNDIRSAHTVFRAFFTWTDVPCQ